MGAPNSLVKSCTPQTQGKTALVLKSNIFKAWVVYLVPSCRLLLNSVHEDDSGTYTCKLSTAKGTQPIIFIFIFIIIIISGLVVINLLTSCVVVLLCCCGGPPEELTPSAQLKVTPTRDPLFTRQLDVLEVMEGRSARFHCKVSGTPPPRVTWLHFGESLPREEPGGTGRPGLLGLCLLGLCLTGVWSARVWSGLGLGVDGLDPSREAQY